MKSKPPVNRALIPSIKKPSDGQPVKHNPVVAIKTNVCEKKNDCTLCRFKPYYGVELVFLIFYANKTVEAVCYKCGKKVAEETGVKLPMTETEIQYSIEAKFQEDLRAARKRGERKSDESKKGWFHNLDTIRYGIRLDQHSWEIPLGEEDHE